MALPSKITYTRGDTIYVVEPSILDVLNAVAAKATAAGRSDLLPVTL